MHLTEIVVNKFFESLEDQDLEQLKTVDYDGAFGIIKSFYENRYGKSPSGLILFILKKRLLDYILDSEKSRKQIRHSLA